MAQCLDINLSKIKKIVIRKGYEFKPLNPENFTLDEIKMYHQYIKDLKSSTEANSGIIELRSNYNDQSAFTKSIDGEKFPVDKKVNKQILIDIENILKIFNRSIRKSMYENLAEKYIEYFSNKLTKL